MPERESKTILKTSAEWQKIFPFPLVYDADGWDRTNFNYSWNEELITEKEYHRRVNRSTCIHRVNKYPKSAKGRYDG
jgi:hypothetical protein